MLPILPTRIHAILDYLYGILAIGLPYIFGFWQDDGPQRWLPMAVGVVVLLVSLHTDYELALLRVVPMRLHLALDVAVGLVMIAAPFVLGFADLWPPFVIFGVVAIVIAAITNPRPGKRATHALGDTISRPRA